MSSEPRRLIGLCLCYTGSNSAYTTFCNEFDADGSARVYVFQIKDELSQIFDRVDVVVWWRRNVRMR